MIVSLKRHTENGGVALLCSIRYRVPYLVERLSRSGKIFELTAMIKADEKCRM